MIDMTAVDEALCKVVARAARWHTIELAVGAWAHAGLKWQSMENERRRMEGAPETLAAPTAALRSVAP